MRLKDKLNFCYKAFLAAVRGERPVAVSGADGYRALAAALQITESLRQPG